MINDKVCGREAMESNLQVSSGNTDEWKHATRLGGKSNCSSSIKRETSWVVKIIDQSTY